MFSSTPQLTAEKVPPLNLNYDLSMKDPRLLPAAEPCEPQPLCEDILDYITPQTTATSGQVKIDDLIKSRNGLQPSRSQ